MVGSIFSDIDPATTSGNQLATILNDFKDIVVSGFKGTTRPTNLLAGGYWIDETNDPSWDFKLFDGSEDIVLLTINTTTNSVIITGTDDKYTITNAADSTVGPILALVKKRITGDQSLANDILGVIEFQGTDTLDVKYIQARIRSTSTDNTTSTTQGSYITFETTPTGTASLVEGARLNSAGNLGVGTAGPDTKIHAFGTDSTASLKVSRVQDIVDAPLVEIHKQRSTGSGQVLINDEVGKVVFKSTDQNTAEVEVAKIEVIATENTTDVANGAKLTIQTKIDTTTTYQTAMEVTDDQVKIPIKFDLTDDGSTDLIDVQSKLEAFASLGSIGQVLKIGGGGTPVWATDNTSGLTAVTKSANATLATTGEEVVFVDTTSGDITLTLPASATTISYRIAKISSDTNKVIIDGDAAETIDGKLTQELYGQYTNIQIAGDASNWFSIKTKTQQIAYVKDEKSSGTSGGTSSAGTYATRDLNTVSGDSDFLSVGSNQITLLSYGIYHFQAIAPAYTANSHKIRLRNTSDATTEIVGGSAWTPSANDAFGYSILNGYVVITASKVFEIQHRVSSATVGSGFGISVGFGDNEVFTQVTITKVM